MKKSQLKNNELLITKEICDHPKNSGLNLELGYAKVDPEGEKECPPDTSEGYYQKVGGQCVFIKNS